MTVCGCDGLVVKYRTRNREVVGSTHTRSTAINLKQVANRVLTPTQPPILSGTGNEWLRGEGLVWLIGVMVCLLAAPWVQLSVTTANGWPHDVLRHHWLIPISCHF